MPKCELAWYTELIKPNLKSSILVELLASAGFVVGLPFNHGDGDVFLNCGAASELQCQNPDHTMYV
jgi:hypothetical protein